MWNEVHSKFWKVVCQKKYENRNGESVSVFTSPSRFLLSFLLVFFLRFLLFVGKFTHYVVNTLPKQSDLKRFFLEVSGISPVTCTWGRLVNVSAGNFQISSVEYNQSSLRSSTVLCQALITFSSEKRRNWNMQKPTTITVRLWEHPGV